MTYGRAIRALAGFLGCDPTEQAVYVHRLASDPAEYASLFLRATNTELLLVDDGYPPAEVGTSWDELGELAGCRALPVLRLETRGEHAAAEAATARERGYAALKSIAAYRGGLDRVSEHVVAALEANEATGDPLPVQVHCGFGDSPGIELGEKASTLGFLFGFSAAELAVVHFALVRGQEIVESLILLRVHSEERQ